ncbi:MAG: FG-GAP repeat protein [Pseudomonadota bacterium]|nr:FG-GAP repeat protein [Pseudomonadota bacterium]
MSVYFGEAVLPMILNRTSSGLVVVRLVFLVPLLVIATACSIKPAGLSEHALNNPPAETVWQALPMSQDGEQYWRRDFENGALKATGDFDGDGKRDVAEIRFSQESNAGKVALFFVSDTMGQPKRRMIDEFVGMDASQVGIRRVAPGRYETVCGKAYAQCSPEMSTVVELHNDGLEFFVFESSHILYYWQPKFERFGRAWLSD